MAKANNDYVAIAGTMNTPSGKTNFPCVFEVDDKGKFSLMLVFKKIQKDEPEFKSMIEKLNEASQEKFGCNFKGPYIVEGKNGPRELSLNSPFKTSDDYDFLEEDEVAIRLKSKYKPQVLDADAETYLEDDVDFYSGCLARATYSATAYDVDGNRGVQFQLNNLQKTGAGKRFVGSRKKAHEEFGAVEQDESLQDMPEGSTVPADDDDIPF